MIGKVFNYLEPHRRISAADMIIITNETHPQCNDIYLAPTVDNLVISLQLTLIIIGIISNLGLLMQFSGRAKLGTARFNIIRFYIINVLRSDT
ncbi:hypothetical protein COOONC_10293 [Cooperia oncophora]